MFFINRPFVASGLQETWLWFTALTGDCIWLDCTCRMMGAIKEIINLGADLCQLSLHPVMQRVDIVFAVIAPGDTALIGDDENKIAFVVILLDRRLGARDPGEVFYSIQIIDIDI